MIKKWFLLRKIQKKEYLNALIYIDKCSQFQNEKAWLYYKLGMFQSAAEMEIKKYSTKGCIAKIISFSMLGNVKKALTLFSTSCSFCIKKDKFLFEIAPYLYSLVLNKCNKIPLYIKIPLLLRESKLDEACMLSKITLQKKLYRNNPELLLYYSNACNISAKQQLRLFNMFLAQYNLEKIYLIDRNKPFFIDNFKPSIIKKIEKTHLVSIIMTSYNSEKYILYALNSLLAQTYKNIEIIVVDDCSVDNTIKIVKEIAKYDHRITLIRLKENVGTYVAKNIALSYAKGEYIVCHDSDDYAHPEKIEKQLMPLIQNNDLVASISYWIRIDKKGYYYARQYPSMMKLNMSSLMFRRDIIKTIGYYDSVRTGADSEYFYRIELAYGRERIIKIKKPLSLGTHRKDSLMNDKKRGHKQNSISIERLSYFESWRRWHMQMLKEKKIPYVPFPIRHRSFDASKDIIVSNFDIKNIIFQKENYAK